MRRFDLRFLSVALLIFVSGALAFAGDYKSTHTSIVDATLEVECMCAVPTVTALQCSLSILDLAAGQPRHTWQQKVFAKSQQLVDLSAACYRKRDADGMGEGRCCTTLEKEASRYFVARILRQLE